MFQTFLKARTWHLKLDPWKKRFLLETRAFLGSMWGVWRFLKTYSEGIWKTRLTRYLPWYRFFAGSLYTSNHFLLKKVGGPGRNFPPKKKHDGLYSWLLSLCPVSTEEIWSFQPLHVTNDKKPGCLGYRGCYTTLFFKGYIIVSHYRNPY